MNFSEKEDTGSLCSYCTERTFYLCIPRKIENTQGFLEIGGIYKQSRKEPPFWWRIRPREVFDIYIGIGRSSQNSEHEDKLP